MTTEQTLFLALVDLLDVLEDKGITILGDVEKVSKAVSVARKAVSQASGNAGDSL